MSAPPKKEYRKRRLFARTLNDVVRDATRPLMNKQGKLYGALLRDWAQIVGAERASVTRPERLQFLSGVADGAILHLATRPAAAPELGYASEQILEQCARYFGYRAITRIVIHAKHQGFSDDIPAKSAASSAPTCNTTELPAHMPADMQAVLTRLAAHITSASDKKK